MIILLRHLSMQQEETANEHVIFQFIAHLLFGRKRTFIQMQ